MKFKFPIATMAILAIMFFSCSGSEDSGQKPEDNRFTVVVLAQRLEEPMQFQVMEDGRVLFAERKGAIKLYDPETDNVTTVGNLSVSVKYVNQEGEVSEAEDGLQGVILDPDFDQNHWIYIYYSPAGDSPKNTLSRFEWDGKGQINMDSEKILLNVPVQRFYCCHVGGGMVFDGDGNLYLSTGDNTFSRASDGFTPIDERPGRSTHDAQKSASNTNDLRGKILRIHPEKDGTYTIPDGNLFAEGTDKTQPEIYIMGNRNPWRLTIDSKTGWLYWGEVGPDGVKDDFEKRGPQSYDEFNMAKKSGNYGWPYFSADNKAYRQYDFATEESGDFFDTLHPVNRSPNNTGLEELPPAVPAIMWYGKELIEEFPLLGNGGGTSAVGGPIYHRSDFKNPKRPFPKYYEGKWFITDWVRGWINVVTFNDEGGYGSMERFLPDFKLRGPIDMKFGPNGDLYVLEYGNGYFTNNPEAKLVKIEYNAGNRAPITKASTDKIAGAVPLTVVLSSEGTTDFDEGDVLTYRWEITKDGQKFNTYDKADQSVTFSDPGIYRVVLTVMDSKKANSSDTLEIRAGNEPPVVNLEIIEGNKTFFFPGGSIAYKVSVIDKEDGSTDVGTIKPDRVSILADYMPEDNKASLKDVNLNDTGRYERYAGTIKLIASLDCESCHAVDQEVLGPSFKRVSERYKNMLGETDYLYNKIKEGSTGVWGDVSMPAHPNLARTDANAIVKFIKSLAYPVPQPHNIPMEGTYEFQVPPGEDVTGRFVLRASYTDNGTATAGKEIGAESVVLRPPFLLPFEATGDKAISYNGDSTAAILGNSLGWLKYDDIDLENIKKIKIIPREWSIDGNKSQGKIEIRRGSAEGIIVGRYSGKYDKRGIEVELSKATKGTGDLYFIFDGSPFSFTRIIFEQ